MSRTRSTPPDPRATLRGGLPDRYLTPDDIAAMFGVPLETVYQWRKKRTGPPGFRIGKHLRYDPADVQTYVTELRRVDADTA
ncbi:helix-turn-helix domain-containing protein [Streptomyces sp. NBC_01306]|uniref:helix-turn-helix domain-containing protein n=1 Tax=Streptomyces sp. NBC_01306 TaxID=2903819 RepID=UPI00225C1C01|nr:helix-turn-helix domain-containing protein [Streptomyces sp. NBC_01306]MCX4726972.1 helix-turn-helix domain-containing protein [Streptomyces sp. NBC_01306]